MTAISGENPENMNSLRSWFSAQPASLVATHTMRHSQLEKPAQSRFVARGYQQYQPIDFFDQRVHQYGYILITPELSTVVFVVRKAESISTFKAARKSNTFKKIDLYVGAWYNIRTKE